MFPQIERNILHNLFYLVTIAFILTELLPEPGFLTTPEAWVSCVIKTSAEFDDDSARPAVPLTFTCLI